MLKDCDILTSIIAKLDSLYKYDKIFCIILLIINLFNYQFIDH